MKNFTANSAGKRSNFVSSMAVKWLKLHRPDVLQAIREEGAKKFPPGTRVKSELPAFLVKLK